jgi:hypothetical protein
MPGGKNIAMTIVPPIKNFCSTNILNNNLRPTADGYSNIWQADLNDKNPELKLEWDLKQKISSIHLFFDCDYDNALPSVFVTHPNAEIPFTIRKYKIYDGDKNMIHETLNNYQAINKIVFDKPIITNELTVVLSKKDENIPVSLYKISVYTEKKH